MDRAVIMNLILFSFGKITTKVFTRSVRVKYVVCSPTKLVLNLIELLSSKVRRSAHYLRRKNVTKNLISLTSAVVSGEVPRQQTLTQHALIRSIPTASTTHSSTACQRSVRTSCYYICVLNMKARFIFFDRQNHKINGGINVFGHLILLQ